MRLLSTLLIASFAALALAACDSSSGEAVAEDALGYQPCEKDFDCGTGRYCNADGYCWSDCRSSADCALVDKGPLCNLFGECVEPGGTAACTSHADCGEDHWCNGRCSSSGAVCGTAEECPFDGETCSGTCSAYCATDNDCIGYEDETLSCTPVGQCLLPGWERWISPGELPPTTCRHDGHCAALGWNWRCDCDKVIDDFTGWEVCAGGGESVCVTRDAPLDLGDGPADSPAHAMRGIWGMRMEIAVVTLGLPLVTKQNTYSSNLFLIRARHTAGDTLEMDDKLCELKLINFVDSDEEFDDLAWMVIPLRYLRSVAVLQRSVEVTGTAAGTPWDTTRSLEVRGCVLDDPWNDPLPTHQDYAADPNDPRFWDQDGDGHVGMTTLMDGVLRGAIYNVQRWQAEYHGEILDADHIAGLADVVNEQIVISASTPSLIYETDTAIHEEEDRTYFRMQRLPDDASCADLIRLANRDNAWLRHTPHLDDVGDP